MFQRVADADCLTEKEASFYYERFRVDGLKRYVNDDRFRVDGDKNMRLLAIAFTIVFVWTGPQNSCTAYEQELFAGDWTIKREN